MRSRPETELGRPAGPLARLCDIGRKACGIVVAGILAAGPMAAPAEAQGASKLAVIRDAEIEQLLRDYMTPIFRAAGVNGNAVEIVIVNDRAFNAFVANGRRIFVNTGALLETKTPNQLIGVLAHETGHIAGGHLARLRQRLETAQTTAIVAMLMGLAGVAAGAVAGASGAEMANVAPAAILAPQQALQRSLLAYARSEEQAADRAALKYLDATGQSGKGMVEVFQKFAGQAMFSARYADPYAQSHPMPADRVASLQELVERSPNYGKTDPAPLQLRHDLMRAKLAGFIEAPDAIARRYPAADTSLPARYARAVTAYRFSGIQEAVRQIDGLIAVQPNNPYFHELKGQALYEAGRPKEAVPPLRRAAALAPSAALIRALLGQALVSTGDEQLTGEAIRELSQAVARDSNLDDAYRQLATAYGRQGKIAEADLASAQSAFAAGDVTLARSLAARAKLKLATGSPGWLRADDIVNYKPPKLN